MTVYWHENLIRAQEPLNAYERLTEGMEDTELPDSSLLLKSIAYSLLSLAEDSKAMVTSGVDVPEQNQ